jgi:2-keto-4-pentenoate hydratase/2-oxohepta-3-ene-1,7-dioic acid hydratase in catechol pathway
MRLFQYESGGQLGIGMSVGESLRKLTGMSRDLPARLQDLIESFDDHRALLEQIDVESLPSLGDTDSIRCPLNSQNIFCIGLNYRDHAEEAGMAIPTEPIVFSKTTNTLAGHGETVVLPKISSQVDYEAELVIVIGQRAEAVTEDQASRHIFGYTLGNDVSARDWQLNKPGKQWLLGKSFTGFAPVGPHVVTSDEVSDPMNLDISLTLNGVTMQSSNTREMVFSPTAVVSYISQIIPLLPGDLIFTGTPPGVGMAKSPPRYLESGDTVTVEIESLGKLTNSFS